jgi:hypothetical protein
MRSQQFSVGNYRGRLAALCARAAIVMTLVLLGALVTHSRAQAHGGVAAAQTANAGLAACSINSGKPLYDCVANVLDRMSSELSSSTDGETQRALTTAASQLRAAVTKVQALSAVTQCRAVVAGVLRRVMASGGPGSGLAAIAGVLAQAAKLIQTKG